jgi:hypothetical protein
VGGESRPITKSVQCAWIDSCGSEVYAGILNLQLNNMMLLKRQELESLRKMPGMYFGRPSFLALSEYLRGMHDALVIFKPDLPLTRELSGFSEWVEKTFRTGRLPFGWVQYVRDQVEDDQARVGLFVDLYLRYRQEAGLVDRAY